MRLIGLTVARNEQWVLGLSARAALLWCDGLVILDHASTDATPQIIVQLQTEYPERIIRLRVDDPTWNEADYRQMLLIEGRRMGGTHFAVIDADEILSGDLLPTIRATTATLKPATMLRLPWRCLWRSTEQYRHGDGSVWDTATAPCILADAPGVRWDEVGGCQIHTRIPAGVAQTTLNCDGGLMHLQFVEWDRLVSKQVLYMLNEVLRWPGAKTTQVINRQYGAAMDEAGLRTAPVPPEWWKPYESLWGYLRRNDEPWQRAECQRLIQEHSRERFTGLYLRGL